MGGHRGTRFRGKKPRQIQTLCLRARGAVARGFTLIELLIVVALFGIMIVLAAPAMQEAILDMRIRSNASEIQMDLMLAKSEAAKRNATVTVCASTDNASCNGSDWSTARIVFADDNGNGQAEAGELIKSSKELSGLTSAGSTGSMSTTAQISSVGSYIGGAGTILLCDERGGSYGRGLNVTAGGVLSVAAATCP